ncbi:MAG: hypothetical protein JO269_10435 [Burkholderiaceae bacterium]|nr:hypothetical protein [Burkholderiaceae bacterium]
MQINQTALDADQAASYRGRVDPAGIHLRRVATGLALSLLLHGMLIAWIRHHAFFEPHPSASEKRVAIEVLLPPPVPPPIPQPSPMEISTKPAVKKNLSKTVVASTPVTQAAPENLPPVAASPAPESPAPETHIDIESVRGSLGAIVAEVDREQLETPLGQVRLKPQFAPQAEHKIEKAIAETARPDCRDTVTGHGLLTPLFAAATLLDKKDSGCKW